MPPKGKHRTTGLVNPGKVTKRKSNHSLHDSAVQANGTANLDASPPPPPPVTPLLSNGSTTGPAKEEDISQPAPEPGAKSSSGLPLGENPRIIDTFPPAPLTMDVHKHGSGGGSSISKSASTLKQLTTATTTILTSCPQRDVIAMLILLLQLSSPVLFVVDFLFAVMTTYLPKLSASAVVMPSFQALFEGTGGAPSIATVILIDVIFFGLWVFMPIPVKNIGLDLAQAVIALSFSGAASSKSGTTRSAAICLATITLFRTLSHRPTRQLGWHFLWTKLLRQTAELQLPPDPGGSVPFIFLDRPSLPRTIVGVHILAQGVLRVIRRSVLAARDGSAQLASVKKVEPGDKLFEQVHGRNSRPADKSVDGAGVSPTDTRAPNTLPITSEAIDRAIAGKRKKKQATLVRSQQPFWAALAHTKVTVSNTMDQNHLSHDANEAHATNLNHIGHANFVTDTDRVWITKVDATEIGFGITLAREAVEQRKGEGDCEHSGSMDKCAPFYVRVNGANWSSTRFAEDSGAGGQQLELRTWRGEIFGLTPLYSYVCEFVRMSDDVVVHTASLITQPAPYTEQAPAPSRQALRPSSPTTTLKASIAAAEAKLHDQRNKLKRIRKEHKAATTAVKKEVDRLSGGLATAGGQDERLKQRANQLKQTIKQAEEATTTADAEARDLGEIPEDDLDEHHARKRSWQKQLDIQNAKRSEIDAAKAHQARECSHVESEIASAVQKRERLQLRQAKLNEQHDRLVRANAQDADEKQQRLAKRQTDAVNRANLEQQYIYNIQEFEAKTQELFAKTTQTLNQSHHLEKLIMQQSNPHASYGQNRSSSPTTPEGPLPGTGGLAFASPGNRNSYGQYNTNYTFPMTDGGMQDSPHAMHAMPLTGAAYGTTHRGRSSSMLSGVSGFTDDLDDNAPNPDPGFGAIGSPAPANSTHHTHMNGYGNGYGYGNGNGWPSSPVGRKGSGDVGSSSGSGSDRTGSASIEGSQRDPTSPAPNIARLSPIGTKPALSPGQGRH